MESHSIIPDCNHYIEIFTLLFRHHFFKLLFKLQLQL